MDKVTDPVGFLTAIVAGLVLLCAAIGVGLAYQCRDDIWVGVKRIVGRYVHVQRAAGAPAPDILLSRLTYEDLFPPVPDPVPVPIAAVPVLVTDDDIITHLAQIRAVGKTTYRFSANALAELIGGNRATALEKIRAARAGGVVEPPDSSDPIVAMTSDPAQESRAIPVRQSIDGSRYILDSEGQRQPV